MDEQEAARTAQERAEQAQTKADKLTAESEQRAKRAFDMYGRFAGGQPLLPGHHSYRSARRTKNRADAASDRAIDTYKAAERAQTEAKWAKAKADARTEIADTVATRSRPWEPADFQAELAQLHIRTIVPPSPKQPAAFGWRAIAGCQAAGFARALHALMEVAPEKAAEITDWYQGPFEEGPDPQEHTDWIKRTVAKNADVLEEWITEARELAVKSAKATADREAGGGEA